MMKTNKSTLLAAVVAVALVPGCFLAKVMEMTPEEIEALNEKSKGIAKLAGGVDQQAMEAEKANSRAYAQRLHEIKMKQLETQGYVDEAKAKAEADAEANKIAARGRAEAAAIEANSNVNNLLATAKARTEAAKMAASVPTKTTQTCYIKVAEGDTWYFLMRKTGFAYDDSEIRRLNPRTNPNFLSVGEKIVMPSRCCPSGGQESPCK